MISALTGRPGRHGIFSGRGSGCGVARNLLKRSDSGEQPRYPEQAIGSVAIWRG